MNTDAHTAQADLAFLRSLVEAGDESWRPFAEGYLAAGLIYGAQMLMHAAQALGWLPQGGLAALTIGLGPTVVFFAALSWVIARHRTAGPGGISGGGTVAKAIGAVFGVAGLANLVLVAVIGSVAWREHSLAIWLIYPCAVFILQGAAWLVSFTLRRRSWHALVALGWFAAAVGMAISIESLAWYILFAGLGLFLCIALPGAALLTLSRKAV